MKDSPLVSITIPTYNSEKTIGRALESVNRQTYKNIETIVIDENSADNTVKIANSFGNTKVIYSTGGLLKARRTGVKKANGEHVLLMDSDQILAQDTIERSVKLMKDSDMLVLEERSWKSENWLERLYKLDREFVYLIRKDDPEQGVILPRFFKKSLLKEAFSNIPPYFPPIIAQDHAIIYFEAAKLSDKEMKYVNNAIFHIEPNNFVEFLRHFYRFGKTAASLSETKYQSLHKKKLRIRGFHFKYPIQSLGSSVLLLLKAMPYTLGYLRENIRQRLR